MWAPRRLGKLYLWAVFPSARGEQSSCVHCHFSLCKPALIERDKRSAQWLGPSSRGVRMIKPPSVVFLGLNYRFTCKLLLARW